jgi:organic radical activating enzyme
MKQGPRGTESRFFELLLKEIKLSVGLERISLLGGEPLLNNKLDQVLDQVRGKKIKIVTGLGVSYKRLEQVLLKTKSMDVEFNVSAESTGKLFELIRYGVSWNDFQRRVSMIEKNGHQIKFMSTISNLSVFGFAKFHDLYSNRHAISVNYLSDTAWMMPHVLDDRSKKEFTNSLQAKQNLPEFNSILDMIKKKPDDKDRINMRDYLKQFSSRRSINLDFLPAHFLEWCGL